MPGRRFMRILVDSFFSRPGPFFLHACPWPFSSCGPCCCSLAPFLIFAVCSCFLIFSAVFHSIFRLPSVALSVHFSCFFALGGCQYLSLLYRRLRYYI